jgi:hypothetical protein
MKKYLHYLLISLIFIFGLSCKKENEKSSEKEILSFTVEEQIDEAIINSEQATVAVLVSDSTNLSSLTPEITISEKASIEPESEETVDFSHGAVTYTVTAEDNTTKDWDVTISNYLSSEAEILSFRLSQFQVGESVFIGQDIYFKVFYGVNFAILNPIIEISEHAVISPESSTVTDFSSGEVIYTVTAQDGTEKVWTAHAEYAPNYQAEIVSFTIPGQTGETTIGNNTVNVEVPYATDLSAITPTIEVSYGSVISPSSGVTVDFSVTGSIEYTVTAEDGVHSKVWTAYVRYPITKADNPNFQYIGRFDFSDPEKPRVWAAGAYIMAKFTGSYCEIALIDEVRYNSNYNYLEIVIDGTQYIRVRTVGDYNTFNISSYLTSGEHTLLICKSTESEMGYIDFLGLHLESEDALLTPDPLPTRKIEFIGNSITCGYGIDLSLSSGTCAGWFDNHNAYMSYGPITARSLDAQWHISARSGIGLIHSCCGTMYTMPDIYSTYEVQLNGREWDFDAYIPDLVTICLGQNDGIQDSTAFCSAYVDFIDEIRGHYPDAVIILLNSPMADNSLNDVLIEYTEAVADYLSGQGDTKIYSFELSHNFNSGCDYHPDMEQHQIIADELSDFIITTLAW